jgi:hypothetical protein
MVYRTPEELLLIAKDMFARANVTVSKPRREKMLAVAYRYQSLADMKIWLSSRDLQSPN